jgi:hypothetical protein
MWDQISEFLFDNYAVAGLQFENWMLVIGLPVLIIFGYFFDGRLSRRSSGAVIPSADEMPEVWRQGPTNRRTAKLERAALKADYAAS